MAKSITILGGGISGLACAYWLRQNQPEAQVTLLERSATLGGKISSHKVGGFLVDAGPDSFVTHRPGMLEFCRELGLESRLSRSRGEFAATYVWDQDRLIKLPPGLHMGIPSRPWTVLMSPLLSPMGKLRLAIEGLLPQADSSDPDESVGSFIRRRLGSEALAKLVGPLSAGIFATDPECLSLQATFPHLAQYEKKYGSLTRALWSAPQPSSGAAFHTFVGGMGELIERLVQRLEGSLHCQVDIQNVSRNSEGAWVVRSQDGSSWVSQALVLAIPTPEIARLLGDLDPALAETLGEMRLSSAAAVHLGFDRSQILNPLQGFGFVSSYPANRPLVACTWSSQKFHNRAPQDGVLLRGFLRNQPDFDVDAVSTGELVATALGTLRPLLGIEGEPLMTRVQRYPQAFPEYRVGHLQRMAELDEKRQQHPGLYWIGSAFSAGGIPECVAQGRRVAEKIALEVAQAEPAQAKT
ncbi:protoporphyrinogen oxidase [bacterium]|nr:protoporphyrinogen oxidase [bacterium]